MISKYEDIRSVASKLESPVDMGWLRISTQPIKSQMMTWTSKWIDLFTNHLKVTLCDKLLGLDKFMQSVSKGREVQVDEGAEGKQALMKVMEGIRDVKKAMDATQEMFQPMQNILNCLKAHGMDIAALPKIGDKIMQDYLDEAPMGWDAVIKKTFKKKEEVRPKPLACAPSYHHFFSFFLPLLFSLSFARPREAVSAYSRLNLF
jgi:dynein heavy chain